MKRDRENEGTTRFTISEPFEEKIKILIVIFLVSFSVLLISIFKTQLEEYIFYIHFFYLPIILSTFWWGKRGIIVSAFLGIFLVLTAILREEAAIEIFSSGVGAMLFVIVALLVGILSDEKNDALKKEMQFKLDTAHYFFNPVCVVEGNLDLAFQNAPETIKEELREAQKAIQRIKNIAMNVVGVGEIRE